MALLNWLEVGAILRRNTQNIMADYGEPLYKPEPAKPYSVPPIGYVLALFAGITTIGMVVSPLTLWLISLRGNLIIENSSRVKVINLGVWTQWVMVGAVANVLLFPINTILVKQMLSPQSSKRQFLPSTPMQFDPGVPGRPSNMVCNSTSKECQQWTELAIGCEKNIKQRDQGYMGKFNNNYCGLMETHREKVTGVALSTDAGAFDF